MNQRELDRAEYLHRLFSEVAASVAMGEPSGALLRAISRRRSRHFPRGRYSRSSILALYYQWRKAPTPTSLVRKYRVPVGRRIPTALVLEFLNRMCQSEVISAYVALQSHRSDWRRGIPLPGLGTWQQACGALRCTPPPFPWGKSTFYDQLSSKNGDQFQRLALAARKGQRDIRRFEVFIEAKRQAFAHSGRHEMSPAPAVATRGSDASVSPSGAGHE